MLLVVGGSSGAERINRWVRANLDALTSRFVVVHVCGPGRIDGSLAGGDRYWQHGFLTDDWPCALATADVALSRAGATTIAELAVTRTPGVLVPLPTGASRGDQIVNAERAADYGIFRVLEERNLTIGSFLRETSTCLTATATSTLSRVGARHERAAEACADVLEGLIARGSERRRDA